MKRKAFKISSNTLFIYKSVKSSNNRITDFNTEPTSSMTVTATGTSRVIVK